MYNYQHCYAICYAKYITNKTPLFFIKQAVAAKALALLLPATWQNQSMYILWFSDIDLLGTGVTISSWRVVENSRTQLRRLSLLHVSISELTCTFRVFKEFPQLGTFSTSLKPTKVIYSWEYYSADCKIKTL